MSRGQQKIQNQAKAHAKLEEQKRKEGQSGQQKRVEKCKTIQCAVCKQTFMGTSTESELHNHSDNRHPKNTFVQCFPNWQEQAAAMAQVAGHH